MSNYKTLSKREVLLLMLKYEGFGLSLRTCLVLMQLVVCVSYSDILFSNVALFLWKSPTELLKHSRSKTSLTLIENY